MPKAGSKEAYESGGTGGGDFGTLPEDTYVFEIVRYENKGQKADPFDPEGKKTYTDIRYFAKPIQYAEDPETPIVDDNTGEAINPDKTVMLFFKPERVGFFGGQPSKNRRLLAAALGANINDDINYEYEDLVGGRFIGSIVRNGQYDNVDDVRPVRAKKERPRPKTAVAAAREAFPDASDLDDDLPF